MRIEAYERMVEAVRSHEAKQREVGVELAAAAAEVAAARKYLSGLVDRAVAGEDLAVEVGKAQGSLAIAEERQRRITAQLEASKASLDMRFISAHSVKSEIQAKLRDGRLLEEFQPLLDELNETRRQYMDKLKALMVAQKQVNKELRALQGEASSIERSLTGESKGSGYDGPAIIQMADFHKWVWVENDCETKCMNWKWPWNGKRATKLKGASTR